MTAAAARVLLPKVLQVSNSDLESIIELIDSDPRIKEADNRVYASERAQLFPRETPRPWEPEAAPVDGLEITDWGDDEAACERYVWMMDDCGLLPSSARGPDVQRMLGRALTAR